jgi:hypothetical protein
MREQVEVRKIWAVAELPARSTGGVRKPGLRRRGAAGFGVRAPADPGTPAALPMQAERARSQAVQTAFRPRCRGLVVVLAAAAVAAEVSRAALPAAETAFYRRYTEGMLRRFMRLSFEAGRTPSLLGREMFRSKVTSCRVRSFEDVVIFCHDMDRCLEKMSTDDQAVLAKIALQEYTQGEAALALGWSLSTTVRQYNAALDRLTVTLLRVGLLEPQKACQ